MFLASFMFRRKRKRAMLLPVFIAVVCLLGILSQTAFAENTYVITDGNAVTVYTSYTSDPAKVLQQAGVTLSKDDSYTTVDSNGISEITVQRAQTISVFYGTEDLSVTSYGETVGALLQRMGISVDDSVQVSVPLKAKTYNGMILRVSQISENTEQYTVEIPFETAYCDDPSLAKGEERILIPGKPGQMVCTANVTYVNTQEIGRTIYQQTVIAEPVKQVVAVGTGQAVGKPNNKPLIGDGVIVLPTGEVLTYTHTGQFVATAYTKTDEGCDEYTANGAHVKWGVVAVDPKVIPYGTRMFIVTNDGAYIYGLSTAEDCGSSIKQNRVDLYMDTYWECINFGIRDCTIYFLGDANWRDN